VFDATDATAHRRHDALLRAAGCKIIDLTPAALGPYVVPPINLGSHLDAPNVNMVTSTGQATIPVVAAVSALTAVHYAEVTSTLALASAGSGTQADLGACARTTARAIETIGKAARSQATGLLDPGDSPPAMRNAVHCLIRPDIAEEAVRASIELMADQINARLPGYQLRQPVRFGRAADDDPMRAHVPGQVGPLVKVSAFLEVTGAAHYRPAYAGNLDMITTAALRTAEWMALPRAQEIPV
jgi:acetaldehyde dehydrogenase